MKSASLSRGHQAGGIEKKRPAHGGVRLGDPTTTARRPEICIYMARQRNLMYREGTVPLVQELQEHYHIVPSATCHG
jgi:hypothetical protein